MSEGPQSFIDSRTVMAIVLVALAWLGWNSYMRAKYPDLYKAQTEESAPEKAVQKEVVAPSTMKEATVLPPPTKPSEEERPESTVTFDDGNWSFEVSSKGMGIKNIQLKSYLDQQHGTKTLGGKDGPLPFSTWLIGRLKPIDFKIEKLEGDIFVGMAEVDGIRIKKTMELQPKTFSFLSKVSVTNAGGSFAGFITYLSDYIEEAEKSVWFLPSFGGQQLFVVYGGSDQEEKRIMVHKENPEAEDLRSNYNKVTLASVGSQYFTQALLDRSDIMPEMQSRVESQSNEVISSITYKLPQPKGDFEIEYLGFAGPKAMDVLSALDKNLMAIIDFGFFSKIATYMLSLLRWFHGILGNWGYAIIFLTLVVRILILPLHLMSYKSMRKMQEIQPRLQELRVKFKDDPQRMNMETMSLMREQKVNPFSSCWPLLLQFPIFIALYRVLGGSIELYQAPFILWIHDLSVRDPYYVLPILMGVALFVQQKTTPNTMDPTQQKIFMIMPVMFSLMMLTLPAGLTLYIFVSTLFGVVQTYFSTRKTREMKLATS